MKKSPSRARRDHIILFSILAVVAIGGGTFLYVLKRAADKAYSAHCAMNMKQIGISGVIWARTHGGLMPTNFMSLSNELVSLKLLHCPADGARPSVNEWEEFSEEKSSYLMVTPGAPEGTTNSVFIRCHIHGHLGFPDGSVFNANRTKVVGKR